MQKTGQQPETHRKKEEEVTQKTRVHKVKYTEIRDKKKEFRRWDNACLERNGIEPLTSTMPLLRSTN